LRPVIDDQLDARPHTLERPILGTRRRRILGVRGSGNRDTVAYVDHAFAGRAGKNGVRLVTLIEAVGGGHRARTGVGPLPSGQRQERIPVS
jgi:hypothetical protein